MLLSKRIFVCCCVDFVIPMTIDKSNEAELIIVLYVLWQWVHNLQVNQFFSPISEFDTHVIRELNWFVITMHPLDASKLFKHGWLLGWQWEFVAVVVTTRRSLLQTDFHYYFHMDRIQNEHRQISSSSSPSTHKLKIVSGLGGDLNMWGFNPSRVQTMSRLLTVIQLLGHC